MANNRVGVVRMSAQKHELIAALMNAYPPPATPQAREALRNRLHTMVTNMQRDARDVFARLNNDPRNLRLGIDQNNRRGTYSEIREDASRAAAAELYAIGVRNPDHNEIYRLGQQGITAGQPNWVAEWILYHRFRYTDSRNRHTGQGGQAGHPDGAAGAGGPSGSAGGTFEIETDSNQPMRFDAARDEWVPNDGAARR